MFLCGWSANSTIIFQSKILEILQIYCGEKKEEKEQEEECSKYEMIVGSFYTFLHPNSINTLHLACTS